MCLEKSCKHGCYVNPNTRGTNGGERDIILGRRILPGIVPSLKETDLDERCKPKGKKKRIRPSIQGCGDSAGCLRGGV